MIQDLEGLKSATEQDFLAVGGSLMEFRSTARNISAEITALTDLISGEQGNLISRALSRILAYSKDMDSRAETGGKALANVSELARVIPNAFSQLRSRVLLFRTLCTLTRIETARLGSAGSEFEMLAEAVKPLSESIHLSGERVLEASSQLEQCLQTAIYKGSGLHNRQLAELRSLIGSVMESVQSFEEARRQAHEAGSRQSAQHQDVCAALDSLVQSIQFHDITRQQIEHVLRSLRQLLDEYPCHSEGSKPPAHAGPILNLQISQLASAESMFAGSVERMQHDLQEIAARVREMADNSHTLMGIGSHEQDSFFLQMERSCTAILRALGNCDTDSAQLRSMASGLEETIARMQVSVAEILDIEVQIQRIAINATIRAAHLGDSGNALNKIAETMQRLVFDSSRNTSDASAALVNMTASARLISPEPEPGLGTVADASPVLEEMREAVLELHSSSERSFSQVTEVACLSSDLVNGIDSVLTGFTAGQLFARVISNARTELEKARSEIESDSPEEVSPETSRNLETFANHYTMQVERDIHDSVAGGVALSDPILSARPVPKSDENALGDNVELF